MLIEIRNLVKNYVMGDIQVQALRDINLTIDRNEYVAIMGPSIGEVYADEYFGLP